MTTSSTSTLWRSTKRGTFRLSSLHSRSRNFGTDLPSGKSIEEIEEKIKDGDLDTLKQWLKDKEIDVCQSDLERRTTLHLACRALSKNKKPEVVEVLLNADTRSDATHTVIDNEGKVSLHYAAECGDLSVVVKLLNREDEWRTRGKGRKDYDEGILIVDGEGRIPLHYAAMSGELSIVNVLLEREERLRRSRNSPPSIIGHGLVDNDGKFPIHYAAASGNVKVLNALLKKERDLRTGATIEEPDSGDIGDTSVHIAAQYGHTDMLKEMIGINANCVLLTAKKNETPLHVASKFGHLEAVKAILASKTKPDVNALSDDEETPLHSAAIAKKESLEIVKLLLEKGAEVNPAHKKKYTKSPFHKAILSGNTDVAHYLLDKDAIVTIESFKEIVNEGYEKLARAVIQTNQWPRALRGTYKRRGVRTTAFRELIVKMPDVARLVLDKCTVEDPEVTDNEDQRYQVLYNYEFIDDFKDGIKTDTGSCRGTTTVASLEKSTGTSDKSRSETFGCSFKDIFKSPPSVWNPDRLPIFSKATHPLKIMVEHKRLSLLKHPVVSSLIHYKWFKFGMSSYIVNLLTYVLYLALLTAFALTVPNPQSPKCNNITNSINSTSLGESDVCRLKDNQRIIIISSLVLLLAFVRFLFELIQLGRQRVDYIRDWINWAEDAQYISTMVFVWIYHNPCFCVVIWQWQVGVVAVFLGWIVMILFVSKLPWVGIYVLILLRISWTFVKMIGLTLLLVISFALTFYMVFFDSEVMRSPFSDVPRSVLKTMTMTTGELDYNDIFRLDPAGGNEDLDEIEYPFISYILWVLFIVFMPVILTNMLTSLAVGDTSEVQDQAQLRKLALQVDQILSVQELLQLGFSKYCKCLPKKWSVCKQYRVISPNKPKKTLSNWFKFKLWEGERYDRSDVINTVLHPQKTEIAEQVDNIEKEILNIKDTLKNIQEQMKSTLDGYQKLTEGLAKKAGIKL